MVREFVEFREFRMVMEFVEFRAASMEAVSVEHERAPTVAGVVKLARPRSLRHPGRVRR